MTTQKTPVKTLDTLFPVPSISPSPQSPARLPGITPESTATLQRTLKDNHVKWHVFFNYKRFHNHTSHQLLAIYQLGANGALLDAAYKENVPNMRPALESPEPITRENYHEHLGKENFYAAYLKFFTSELLQKGAAVTFEEYVFSPKANIEPPKPGAQPLQMTSRFLSGLLHPLIHMGYGAEFGLLGMFAEGLAQTAVHLALAPALTPPSLWQYTAAAASDATNAAVSRITSVLPHLALDQFPHGIVQPSTGTKGVHALSLIARILKDDYYSYKTLGFPLPEDGKETPLERVLHLRGDALVELMKNWTVDGTNARDIERKIEELFWTNALLFGVGGWGGRAHSPTGKFNGDFLLLHLVTSSLFLPSLVAYLSPTSATILLRTYLLNSLALYVSRGRPALSVSNFFASVSATPSPPSSASLPTPADGTLTPENPNANPWLELVQSTVMHPDDHLCKLQRSLAHFAALYGATPAGHFSEVKLEGAEKIDGTLFVRVAGLSMDRVGWMREGEERREWDFDGFYHD